MTTHPGQSIVPLSHAQRRGLRIASECQRAGRRVVTRPITHLCGYLNWTVAEWLIAKGFATVHVADDFEREITLTPEGLELADAS
jgi:hypothetical protein